MTKASIPAWLKRLDVTLFLLCVVVLLALPQIDLMVSGWFYDPASNSFPLGQTALLRGIYLVFGSIHLPLLLLLPVAAIYAYRKHTTDLHRRWIHAYLLASLVLGPGLLVNAVLKDNSIGRARPSQVAQFGGERTFTPAFVYSGQCERNCSFVSGHGSMGFWFIGLGWLLRSRAAFLAGLSIGVAVGFTRIAQGGHFFSDTVFAFWAVYFVYVLLARGRPFPEIGWGARPSGSQD